MYQQSTSYECGPYALKHALQMLGVFADERRLARLAGTSQTGTDEVQLARAAGRLDCSLPLVRAAADHEARRALTAQLEHGCPALLCVDQWEHWVAVVGGDGVRFVVLDSADPRVVVTLDWERLRDRWGYRDASPGRPPRVLYDAHPVVPNGAVQARGAIDPGAAVALARPDRAQLVRDWSAHSRELLALAAPAAPGNGEPTAVDLPRLLDERRAWLLERAAGTDAERRRAAATVLRELELVARVYRLRVLRERSAPVLAGVADLLRRRIG